MKKTETDWRLCFVAVLAVLGFIAIGGDSIEPISTTRSVFAAISVSLALILVLEGDILFFRLMGRFNRFMDSGDPKLTIKIKK
jgi:hypothetical protein